MHHGLITDLGVVTIVAALTVMLTRRLGQPSILGYLFAGLIVGPYIPIPLFADPARMEELAEVGVVLVMFAVGLEFRIKRLLDILPVSGLTAGVQIASLSWAGFTIGSILGWSSAASVCLGAALAISSTMVVSSVLRSRPLDPDIRAHVYGILVVQDVVAIVLIAIVTTLAAGGSVGMQSLGLLVGQLSGAVIVMLVAALLVLPRLARFALAQSDDEVLVVLIAGSAFGLAMAASVFGYSVALGAFIAGMGLAESGRGHDIERVIEPLRSLFSAIFFVSIGMAVDPLVAWRSLPLALGLSAVVITTQFLSVAITTTLTGNSLRMGVHAGLALGQIGELSFILATIAVAGGVVPEQTLSALVTVATITAFTTPLLLGRALSIVDAIDRRLPDRAHNALAAYQSFIRGARRSDETPSLRLPALAVLVDWLALIVVFVARYTILPRVEPRFEPIVNVGAVVIAAPFVLGLVRSALRLAAGVRALARGHGGPVARAKAVEAIALLAVVLGVGLPTVALLRPFVEGPWVEATLLGVLLAVLVVLGMRLGKMEGAYTSGVARIALDIAGQLPAGADDVEAEPGDAAYSATEPLAGLDYRAISIPIASPASGMTLAELDLRCRSGANVIAIHRDDTATMLPTGHERLRAGDVLAVSGSPAALLRARGILQGVDDATRSA